MICAYCGRKAKGTKEHIISSGVLDLFPECFLTLDGKRGKVYPSDPMVNDVCEDCNNNKISYIDSYAKELIKKYFLISYSIDDRLKIDYDYSLVQKMCLKYAFNDLRSKKEDVSFFDDEIKKHLTDSCSKKALRNITILGGLAVNNTPVPDYIFGNRKLRWVENPCLFCNSIILDIDHNTGKYKYRDECEIQEFEKLLLSYVFRFNSLQLLLLCWDKEITDEELNQNHIILQNSYPYTLFNAEGSSILNRCTSGLTYHQEELIDVTLGQSLMDELMSNMKPDAQTQGVKKKLDDSWQSYEDELKKKYRRM